MKNFLIKKWPLLCFLLISSTMFSQITIDNTTYSTTQLVDGVLVPAASGTVISNVTYGGVYNISNRYQVGYFSTATTTQTEMGFTNGVILSSGNTSSIPLGLGSDPGATQIGQNYTSCTTGEIRQGGTCPAGNNDLDILAGSTNYYNASVLEFDFVPVDTNVTFRYIFGSEEYNDSSNSAFDINYNCSSYNDKFGFLISGPGISGGLGYDNDARNIARLGNGSEVSINSVNDGIVGSSGGAPSATNCTSANGAWIQNTPTAEFLGPIDGTNMNGNTRILSATQSGLTPGQTYHIKLIVTDVNDGTYDSVVYLEAGSFTTESSCNAGPDQSLCGVTNTTLAASAPATGTWSNVSGTGSFTLNTDPNTTVTGLSLGANVFRWTAGDLSCTSDVTITVVAPPNAGTNGTLNTCQGTTPTNAELFTALNGTPDAGGTWSNTGLVYTYTVNATTPCTGNATATVTVTEQAQPNAGTNGTLNTCQGTTPTNTELFTALNGIPDAGGTWSNTGLVYTYTVNATTPCTGNATATVTVTEQAQPNAGTNGTLNTCQGTTPTNAELFTALNGIPDAGGAWSNTGLVYTYTVNATPPCTGNATATVTITEQAQPNAGTNGTLNTCQGTTPTNAELFTALNGTPDAGGAWSNTGLVYTYTVNATPPCTGNATATVTVTEQAQPNAGTNGTLNTCQGTTPTNAELFTALNGTPDAGGAWSNTGLVYTYTVNATPPCTGNATATVTVTEQAQPNAGTNGTLNTCQGTTPTNAELFTALNGTPDAGGTWSNTGLVYTYTVNATTPCTGNATATVTVTEQAQPNAGTNGTLNTCQGTTPTNAELFTALNGTPDAGGTWSNTGLVYTYTVNATTPCTGNATATVTVTEQAQPNAGTNGTLNTCQGTTPTNAELFTALNGTPDAGGTWSNTGLVYTYTVNATTPCTGNATATVTVTEQAQPSAGTNGTLNTCQGTTPTNAELFTALNGTPDAGGTWSNTGLVYTYTVNATTPCTGNATATVTVTEQAQPNAGTNGTLNTCQGTTPTNAELFTALNGTPDAGGTWSNTGLVYSYTVSGSNVCPDDTALVTITVNEIEDYNILSGCDGVDFKLEVSPIQSNAIYQWLNSSGQIISTNSEIVITQEDTYELIVSVNNCSENEFITINNTHCSIPLGISPNNDGANDTWDLSNLDIREVKIFNRYGVELYSKKNYTNEWNGTSKGKELPSATYYYAIWFNNGTTKTGWIYLNR